MIHISSLSDANALVDGGIKESINLEYKSELTQANKELAKDVSSFGNSEGGVIVYGMEEDNELPKGITGIDKKGNRERIEQVINSQISPHLDIRLSSFDLASGDKEIIIVKIPKSINAPHMVSSTGRFYKRGNVSSPPVKMGQEEISLLYERRNRIKEFSSEEIRKKQKMLNIFHSEGWSAFEYIIICPTLNMNDAQNFTKELITNILSGNNRGIPYGEIIPHGYVLEPSQHGYLMKNVNANWKELLEFDRKGYITISHSLNEEKGEYYVNEAARRLLSAMSLGNMLFREMGYFGNIEIVLGFRDMKKINIFIERGGMNPIPKPFYECTSDNPFIIRKDIQLPPIDVKETTRFIIGRLLQTFRSEGYEGKPELKRLLEDYEEPHPISPIS